MDEFHCSLRRISTGCRVRQTLYTVTAVAVTVGYCSVPARRREPFQSTRTQRVHSAASAEQDRATADKSTSDERRQKKTPSKTIFEAGNTTITV